MKGKTKNPVRTKGEVTIPLPPLGLILTPDRESRDKAMAEWLEKHRQRW